MLVEVLLIGGCQQSDPIDNDETVGPDHHVLALSNKRRSPLKQQTDRPAAVH